MKLSRLLGLSIAISPVALSFGWHARCHMVVADIAKAQLTPNALKEVERLLNCDGQPGYNQMGTAAVWADDRKTRSNGAWHYINIHFRKDGKPVENDPAKENVSWAIQKYSRILAERKNSDPERAEALRYLLHFVGDIHQPMHCTTLDSDSRKTGDRGGNLFKLQPGVMSHYQDNGRLNLHTVWDDGLGLTWDDQYNPVSDNDVAQAEVLAKQWAKELPKGKLSGLSNLDPNAWVQEGSELAQRVAYSIEEGAPITNAYMVKGQEVSKKRIVTAGYRMGALLNKLLSGR